VSTWIDKDGRRHVGIMVGGKRVHRILPAGAPAGDAKQLEADLRSALKKLNAPIIPGDPPLTAVMGLFLEHAKTLRSPATATHHANRVGPWAEKYRASEARECAAAMIRDMHGHYEPATINRSLSAMKKALTIAWDRSMTPENYGMRIKCLPVRNARDMTLTVDQVKLLADCASEQVAAAIWIGLFTGCRRGEILALRPEDIGENEIIVHAGNTKTLKTRVIPIIPPLRKYLKLVPLALNFEGLKTGFRRAREAAGMPWVNFHDLRRSCATLMIQAPGADLYAVSKLLGHSTVGVTQARYAHLQVEQVRRGLEAAFTPAPKRRSSR
jgi:integrase